LVAALTTKVLIELLKCLMGVFISDIDAGPSSVIPTLHIIIADIDYSINAACILYVDSEGMAFKCSTHCCT